MYGNEKGLYKPFSTTRHTLRRSRKKLIRPEIGETWMNWAVKSGVSESPSFQKLSKFHKVTRKAGHGLKSIHSLNASSYCVKLPTLAATLQGQRPHRKWMSVTNKCYSQYHELYLHHSFDQTSLFRPCSVQFMIFISRFEVRATHSKQRWPVSPSESHLKANSLFLEHAPAVQKETK